MKSVSKKAIEPLTEEELCFFKTYGYLIKPDVLPSQVCDELVDLMWESAPSSLRRHDPDSYQPLPEQDWSSDATLFVHGDKWQYRACGTRQPLIDAMTHPQLWQWGEQLLGEGNIRPPKVDGKPMGHLGQAWPEGPVDPQNTEGVRGIYATLPNSTLAGAEDGLHTDGHPFHFGWVCLLEDCPPDSGAFKVWPGSHQRFAPLFPMPYDQARIPFYDHLPAHKGILHPSAYLQAIKDVEADTQPVDCYGKKGSVVLWHHRLGHMAGHHKGEHKTIRQALLFDYNHVDLDTQRCKPTPDDLWQDWSAELRAADHPLSRALKAEQMLPA